MLYHLGIDMLVDIQNKVIYEEDKVSTGSRVNGGLYKTRSANFCGRFYLRADIFEGQFCGTPNTIKIKLF